MILIPEFLQVLIYQEQDIVLGRYIMVKLPHGHAAFLGYLTDICTVKPLPEEQF